MKETKACKREFCDKSLPASSKYDFCQRCRIHDKRCADRPSRWIVERHETVNRWDAVYSAHLPKQQRNVVRIESRHRPESPTKPRTMARVMTGGGMIRKRA